MFIGTYRHFRDCGFMRDVLGSGLRSRICCSSQLIVLASHTIENHQLMICLFVSRTNKISTNSATKLMATPRSPRDSHPHPEAQAL